MRPLVRVALVREYTYAYAAVSPQDGSLVWMLAAKMDTLHMSVFLEHVSASYPDEFVMVVLDGASSHRSFDLRAPENIAFVRLPAYSPELKPAERFWEELRKMELVNRVFELPRCCNRTGFNGTEAAGAKPWFPSVINWMKLDIRIILKAT
jgi:hypothetical protein